MQGLARESICRTLTTKATGEIWRALEPSKDETCTAEESGMFFRGERDRQNYCSRHAKHISFTPLLYRRGDTPAAPHNSPSNTQNTAYCRQPLSGRREGIWKKSYRRLLPKPACCLPIVKSIHSSMTPPLVFLSSIPIGGFSLNSTAGEDPAGCFCGGPLASSRCSLASHWARLGCTPQHPWFRNTVIVVMWEFVCAFHKVSL